MVPSAAKALSGSAAPNTENIMATSIRIATAFLLPFAVTLSFVIELIPPFHAKDGSRNGLIIPRAKAAI